MLNSMKKEELNFVIGRLDGYLRGINSVTGYAVISAFLSKINLGNIRSEVMCLYEELTQPLDGIVFNKYDFEKEELISISDANSLLEEYLYKKPFKGFSIESLASMKERRLRSIDEILNLLMVLNGGNSYRECFCLKMKNRDPLKKEKGHVLIFPTEEESVLIRLTCVTQ